MEILTPAAISTLVKSREVNWLPWSLLKMSGRPNRARAYSSASRQKSTSMVFDTRHARIFRVAQSMTATR